MAGKERLEQIQATRLLQKLNPQQLALGRLLEMTGLEFEDEIKHELDDNPALEIADQTQDTTDDFNESSEQLQLADYADEDELPSWRLNANNHSADDPYYDAAVLAADDSMSTFNILTRRLDDEHQLDPATRHIAHEIIGNLDDNGYLTRSLDEISDDIAISEGFYPTTHQINLAYEAVRALDPAGIGARDLRDCLLLQLNRIKPSIPVLTAKEIVDKYFDLFSKKHYDRLQGQLEISRENLSDALDVIKSLNPKPASSIEGANSADRVRHITPDFVVDYDEESDKFSVSMANKIPELAIEESFSVEPVIQTKAVADAITFIRKKREEANSFIKLVELRSLTLLAIMRAIVEIQKDFFITGDSADLRPMILKDISSRTGLDISVVSRATAGKYVVTAHGTFPLKLLFNEKPSTESDASTPEILAALSKIILAEDKNSPLSDRELQLALKDMGYDIARRTVAKYRERLGMPVARLRKTI